MSGEKPCVFCQALTEAILHGFASYEDSGPRPFTIHVCQACFDAGAWKETYENLAKLRGQILEQIRRPQ